MKENKQKRTYERPEMMAVELQQEVLMRVSVTTIKGTPIYNRFNDEEEW